MAAADGRSKVLDAAADGYSRGEACRALWLGVGGQHSSAGATGQPLALLAGTAVNTNAQSSSLTAPHGELLLLSCVLAACLQIMLGAGALSKG